MFKKAIKNSLLLFSFIIFLVFFSYQVYEISSEQFHIQIDELQQYDCGVVLTGGPGRIREAIEILALKKIKKLIISGVYKDAPLSDIFPALPFYPEVQTEDIILEKRSESTYGNAVQSLAYVQSLQCRSVLLITSQLHMYRSYYIFKSIYPEQIILSKQSVPTVKETHFFDLMLESVKFVFYLVFGRVI